MIDYYRTGRNEDRLENEVAAAARDRLQHSPHAGLRSVSCQYHRGVLVLRGRVSSFYEKQLAQHTVAGIRGVAQVYNETEVAPQPLARP